MSIQGSVQDITHCPNCKTEVSPYGAQNLHPQFCLQCRFPLMLVANKYRLLRAMDEGGFGIIYEALHTRLTRDPRRVIKVIRPELVASDELQQRFAREVQVTSALSQMNSHIVRIHDDFGEIPNLGHFYVMEYLEGQALSDMLKDAQGLLPLGLCYHLFTQLCDAMHAAHTEGVVHRDLKPENLFVTSRPRNPHFLKVIDFGIARPKEGSGEKSNLTQGILGTPAYMAPEQSMAKDIDERADIYAMGIILFELLTGRTPFAPRSAGKAQVAMMEMITAHLMQPPPPLHQVLPAGREVPEALEHVVAKAIAKLPDERYANVLELEAEFTRAISETDDSRPKAFTTIPWGSTSEEAEARTAQHTPPPAQLPSSLPTGVARHITPLPQEDLPTTEALPPDVDGKAISSPESDTAPQEPFVTGAFQITPQPRSSRALLGGLLFLALLAAGVGGWWFWQQRQASLPQDDTTLSNDTPQTAPRRDQMIPPPPRVQRSPFRRAQAMAPTSPGQRRNPAQMVPKRRGEGDSVVSYIPPTPQRRSAGRIKPASRIQRRSVRTRRQIRRYKRRIRQVDPSGCPRKPGHRAVYLKVPSSQCGQLVVKFLSGSGQFQRYNQGYCVWRRQPTARIQLLGLQKNYVPCMFQLSERRSRVKIQLTLDEGIPPESSSYCLRR